VRSDPFYNTLLDRLTASWVAQPDKPEETPESNLEGPLFFSLQAFLVSVQKASQENVPELDDHSRIQLQSLVENTSSPACPLPISQDANIFWG